jgi:cytochrome d ubiquinol oxidase subunit I
MDGYAHVLLSRIQFGMTAMFHITWAALSVGLSAMLVIFEGLWLKTGDNAYYHHTRFWSKLFLLVLAVGVVSGVPMEFQFGTNWGKFSAATGGFFGNILGFETVSAFMLEAGFLGIMFFGWNRVSKKMHFFATCMVALGASLSAFWILVANSWMLTPHGGYWNGKRYIFKSFWGAVFSPDMPWGTSHMWVACLEYTLFVMGGISAWYILKKRHVEFFTRSLKVALILAIVVTPVQIYLGDGNGRIVARYQPAKLAGIESHWNTNPPGTGATWHAFAWPDKAAAKNSWTFLNVPYFLSILTTHKLISQVPGLKAFPRKDWPPIVPIFYAFRVMAGIAFLLLFLMLGTLWYWRRGQLAPERITERKWLLSAWVGAIPLGWLAIETGWITREMGRQPWIIYNLLRTTDGASTLPATAVGSSLFAYAAVYTILFTTLIVFAWQIIKKGPDLTRLLPGQAKLEKGGAWPWK